MSLGSAPVQIIDGDRGRNYPSSGDLLETGHCLFLSARNVTKRGFDFTDQVFVTHEKDRQLRAGKLQREDVVLTTRGTVGNVAYFGETVVEDHMRINSGMVILRADGKLIDSSFLYSFMRSTSFTDQVESLTSGSAQPQLPIRELRQVLIPVPDLAQQRAIAEVLGALADKIAANTKLATTSAALASALFQAEIVSQSEVVPLSKLCTLISRGVSPKYSVEPEATTVLNQKCIRGQRVDVGAARKTESSKVREDKLLRRNDVLVNSTGQGTLGRVARWTNDLRATADSHISILRFDPSLVDPVCGGFGVLRMQLDIEDLGEGSTGQTELSRTALARLPVRLPSVQKQNALGRRLETLTYSSDAAFTENITLAATRDALLPQLMSGKMRVKDVDRIVANL